MRFLFVLILFSLTSTFWAFEVETRLSNGSPLRGYIIQRGDRFVRAYRGIPYARPPQRFQRADADVEPWTEIRDASIPGPSCPGGELPSDNQMVSEDCLYVDVYIDPGCVDETCAVSVVLKGVDSKRIEDSFVIGHNKSDPEVMIFINYRFSVFGFLDVGEEIDEFPYNVGLHDLIQAMRWVKREALSFHGDPNRVSSYTFRESATFLQLMLLSPVVDRTEVPLETVLLNNHRPVLYNHENRNSTDRLLRAVRCKCDFEGRELKTKEQINCLRSKSMDNLWRSSPSQHEFGPQSDSKLLPAQSFVELMTNWKPTRVYTISGENVPFLADRNQSLSQLCRTYAVGTFGYKSSEVVQRCIGRYKDHESMVGRHAVHAVNALLGARNNRTDGQTFAARFSQPEEDGGEMRYIFADHAPETVAEHQVHEFMLLSRELFGHRQKAPAEDFLPVDSNGRNFYDIRFLLAEDNRTVLAEPRMHVGSWIDSDAVDFWLNELSDLEARSQKTVEHVTQLIQKPKENDNENSVLTIFVVIASMSVLIGLALWVMDKRAQRKKFRRTSPLYSSINYDQ
ncbi:Venom carboxylesterase-6-like isoform X1 [Aphelenchoides besseyi]|nr:Venom carboxylesterase-6-like isoform X1 [Aphelenchoides besseyi]